AAKRIAAHLDAVLAADSGGQTAAGRLPERFQIDGGGREDGDVIARGGEVAAEPGEGHFRAAQRRWIPLYEVRHSHAAMSTQAGSASEGGMFLLRSRFRLVCSRSACRC